MTNLPDVVAVLPFGDTETVKILTSKSSGITKKAVAKAISGTSFKIQNFKHKKLTPKKKS